MNMFRALPTRRRLCRGSAMVMVVLISVVLTGLVMTVAWSGGIQSMWAGGSIHVDQANQAAESAGQIAVWNFKHNNSWRQATVPKTMPTVSIGGSSFSMATICTDAGATATLYWPFTEGSGTTTADTSGHNNTGTLIGGVSWTPGRYGEGLLFDGSTGYVDAGAGPSTNIVGPLTMAAWVQMNSAAQDQKIGGNEAGGTKGAPSGGYKMSIYGQKVEFELHDINNTSSYNRYAWGGTILEPGVWYHLAGVWDSGAGTITTFVDGSLDRKSAGYSPTALAPSTGTFQMGREPWSKGGNNRYFDGTLDDVRVYNRALSAQEIRTLANTSVHVHAMVTQTGSTIAPATAAVDFVCSAPAPLPPVAPALTTGGSLQLENTMVSGDVEGCNAITIGSPTSVSGVMTYGTTFADPGHFLSLPGQGKGAAPAKRAGTVPTIDYATIAGYATGKPFAGGSKQKLNFNHLDSGIAVLVVNGDATDPQIDTSQTSGTVLITGNLNITKSATWGSANFPAYIVVEGNITQTAPLTLIGALYAGKNWTHTDASISGDICVGGNVTDSSSSSSFVTGGIPWFDPRGQAPPIPQSLFYAGYQGAHP